ncbi:MAG TPA: RDD family protein [Armatimonadota bacterium]
MPREITVVTPENTEIRYSLAGLGSRFVAALVDALLQGFVLLAFSVAIGLASGGFSREGADIGYTEPEVGLVVLFTILIYLFLVGGYYLLFETLWHGQTPGKKLLGIRVIQESGRPVGFYCSAARNILRLVDMLPAIYLVGMIAILVSKRYKRLGDYVAGTLVVKEYREERPRPPRLRRRISRRRTPAELPEPAATETNNPEPLLPGIHLLSRDDYNLAQRLLDRRGELPPEAQTRLARQIATPMMRKLGYTTNDESPTEHWAFLEEVTRAYLKRDSLRY